MIVLDASVILPALFDDGESRALLAREDVHVPHLADCEVAQAVRGIVRRGAVAARVAETRLAGWAALGVRRHGAELLLGRIWALRDVLSAYDATYVALAEALGCPFATADEGVARARGLRCEVVVPGS